MACDWSSLNSEVKMSRKVLVVMSRNHARIWANGLEPHTKPEIVEESYTSPEAKGVLNKFFSGRDRSQLTPAFAEKLTTHLKGADEIYILSAGKGKSDSAANYLTYLKQHHAEVAGHIRKVEHRDITRLTEGEILAAGRKLFDIQ